MSFSIGDSEHDAQTHVIEVGGEIDLSNATLIDSTTLGVLVSSAKRLRPEGGAIAVVCTAPTIRKIFEITGLDRVLAVHSTRDDALSAIAEADRTGADA